MELLRMGDFDYLHGGLGACLYYLERSPTPAITRFVEQLVNQLLANAIRYSNGDITWLYTDFDGRPADAPARYNLGLSHGTPSIVAILSLLYQRGYARNQCAELIQGNLNWLWNCRKQTGYSTFPHMVGDEQQEGESRLAWCYSDLGIANTFWVAGETLLNGHWKQIAEYAVLKAATRRCRKETSVADAGLCHGSAGAAHLFSRFASRFPVPTVQQAANYWLEDTFNWALPPDENAAFFVVYLYKQR